MGFFVGFLVFRLYATRRLTFGRLGTPLEMASLVLIFGFLSFVGTSNGAFAAPLIFGVCVYVFAHESGWISILLRTSPFLKIGEWSYSIYMVHAFILIVMLRLVSATEKLTSQPIRIDVGYAAKLYYFYDMYVMDIFAVSYLFIVVSLASFTYRRVEDPARRFFNAVAKTHERGSAESRPAEVSGRNGT
jgi:hypothetical protein